MTNIPQSGGSRISKTLRRELRALVTFNPSDRPWEMPASVAFATGAPLLLGAGLERIGDGAIASIGAIAFLYLPRTPLRQRMTTLAACAFLMTGCYLLGLLTHLAPALRLPVITLVAIGTTMICRYYRLMPPGSLFLVMATAIGAYAPLNPAEIPHRLLLFALGAAFSCLVALAYSLHIRRRRNPLPAAPPPDDVLGSVIIDSVIIGVFVALSAAAAELLWLDKPYWVPVSCLAVIQGVSLRAVWTRQIHRIAGTLMGLGVTWLLVLILHDGWTIAAGVTVLMFLIETAVVRHYGFAAIFITPLTILLAEAPMLGHADSQALIAARLADTVLGSLLGLAGGLCVHRIDLRRAVAGLARKAPRP